MCVFPTHWIPNQKYPACCLISMHQVEHLSGKSTRSSQARHPSRAVHLTRLSCIRTAPPIALDISHSSAPTSFSRAKSSRLFAMLSRTTLHSSSHTALRGESVRSYVDPCGAASCKTSDEDLVDEPKYTLVEFLAQECPSGWSNKECAPTHHLVKRRSFANLVPSGKMRAWRRTRYSSGKGVEGDATS